MNEFKLIVAGGRDFNDYARLSNELMELANDLYRNESVSIVSGVARGADALAVRFAKEHGVVLYEFPADWDAHGKAAGFYRNEMMGEFADGLLAYWDGQSRGTAHMIDTMTRLGKEVFIRRY